MTVHRIRLDELEYDMCWHDLGLGEQRPSLTVVGHGTTVEERSELRAHVYDGLARRRLAQRSRTGEWTISDALTEALVAVARAPVWLDMIWLPHRDATASLGAVAVWDGSDGIVATRIPPGPDEGLHLWRVPEHDTVSTLLSLLPGTTPAPGRPVSVATNSSNRSDGGFARRVNPRDHDQRAATELLTGPVTSNGVITARSRGRVRESAPLHWQDGPHGRVVVYRSTIDHATVAPADPTRVHDAVRTLLRTVS